MASNTAADLYEEWEMRYNGGGVSEIEEEMWTEESEKNKVTGNNRSGGGDGGRWSSDYEENAVYVAVWKESEEMLSMDALLWTLNNVVIDPSSALVILVHVFSQTKCIPTPLGKLPINQVNPEQQENFLAEESRKRRDLLQKFLNACSASQVKVDTVLIESDMEAKAILDLIPILNIRKLVLGASKTTVRYFLQIKIIPNNSQDFCYIFYLLLSIFRRMKSSKKGNGVADQIVQNAPEICEVKIICQGKEISELTTMESPSPSPSLSPKATHSSSPKLAQTQQQTRTDSFACGCFKI